MSRTGSPAWAIGALALSVVGSCGRPPEEAAPRIVLGRSESTGSWQAVYELGAEIGYLRFQRSASFYRESVWKIATPGWQLDRDGDQQTLVAEPGAETDRLVVEFPVHTGALPKEYEFFLPFTDGSVAIYSGHLYVTASGAEVPDEDAVFLRRLELVPGPHERLVVQGQVLENRSVWEDPHGDGTYIYYGRLEPVETGAMMAIIDRGAPAWLVKQLHAMLPSLFAMYEDSFGEALPWKPVVLFGFDDRQISGLSSGGGTLTGLVQMTAVGSGWHEATPEASEHLLYLLAHEAAHFWNGQVHSYQEMADSWMHEGSADAFAALALRHYELIDDERLAQRRSKALNDCALGLRDGSLSTSNRRQQFQNYYSCGELIAVWSVAALPGPIEMYRLFDVWRAVFEGADPGDGSYNRETYFEALASLGVEAELIDLLRGFLDREHSDPAAALIDLMASVGIEIERLGAPAPAPIAFPVLPHSPDSDVHSGTAADLVPATS